MYIALNADQRKVLSEKFGVTYTTISESAHFKSKSELQRKIRSYAVNMLGGQVIR